METPDVFYWKLTRGGGELVRVTVPRNRDVAILLFVNNVWFIGVRGERRTCDTCKLEQNSLQLKADNNFNKKLHFIEDDLKIWIRLFFQIWF